MNAKSFTLINGLYLPILKSLSILGKSSDLRDILSCIKSNGLYTLNEIDKEIIDFNGKLRIEYSLEHALDNLVNERFIIQSGAFFEISPLGVKKVELEWSSYHQEKFVKNVMLSNSNKSIYSSIPEYLFNITHKKTTVYGFQDFEGKYVKLLNDFLDYIELNYPSIEEMASFLAQNYNFSSSSASLNAINVIRSCSLVKIIGKNLNLTKLGQWYINTYDNISLLKIFMSIYLGFEEIFVTIAKSNTISIPNLKQILLHKYNFDWIDSNQFTIRLNWLKDMQVVNLLSSDLSLSKEGYEFAEFLGIINTEETNSVSLESTEHTANEMDDDFDNIIDDMISESQLLDDESASQDDLFDIPLIDEESDVERQHDKLQPSNIVDKNINLSQQERNFLLNNIDINNEIFENEEDTSHPEFDINNDEEKDLLAFDFVNDELISEEEASTSKEPLFVEKPKKSVVIQIPTKNNSHVENFVEAQNNSFDSLDLSIRPEEISNLVNLPNNIISKIATALNMGKHLILTGPHGSGKTSIAVILAKLAHQKGINSGYNLTSATESWSSLDTIGGLMNINDKEKFFKEGFILKSIRENKWLLIDEIGKCDTNKCFDDFINAFYGHNTILSYMHQNYKNIEIISEPTQNTYEINQYVKNSGWRMIATMDNMERHHINFSSAFIRRFAFIDIGINNYSSLIDKYFIKNNLQNDLLKNKVKNLFSETGLLKFKDIGASSIHDLIQYISIRSKLLSEDENIHTILAEGLELYIIPQLQILDKKVLKEIETYLFETFDGYDGIKKALGNAL